ncbi:cold-shock protein [Winogradskyella tangerina]|uniref:cold-shock protein n=1 Tax=Winogradskyella tangerina TaxID=2023240 RepID=UPI000DBE7732|nr:cold shock domain-containing protein [Winogradskyella tangerina]
MADSYNKKEREKKRKKKKEDKAEKKRLRQLEEKTSDFIYVDERGNLTSTPQDPNQKKEVPLEEISISIPKLTESELDQEEKEKKGIVKFYNVEKGFGFIKEVDQKIDYFVHADNLIDNIKENDNVLFENENGPKGPVAIKVKLIR